MDDYNHKYNQFLDNAKSAISNWVYPIFASVIVIAMVIIKLGVFEFNKNVDILDIIVEALPIFIASMLLANIFYQNGATKGKRSQNYFLALTEFSRLANMPGEKLDALPEFCREFNENALKDKKRSLLSCAVIPLSKFEEEYEQDGGVHVPIKVMSNSEIIAEFGKERSSYIIQAKKVKIKGINAVTLTSDQKVKDVTDTGYGEHEYAKMFTAKKAISYALTFIMFAFISVKDVYAWGWAGVGLLVFKIAYTLGCSILGQIQGFKNITIDVVAHLNRKSDILKQFHSWYENRNK